MRGGENGCGERRSCERGGKCENGASERCGASVGGWPRRLHIGCGTRGCTGVARRETQGVHGAGVGANARLIGSCYGRALRARLVTGVNATQPYPAVVNVELVVAEVPEPGGNEELGILAHGRLVDAAIKRIPAGPPHGRRAGRRHRRTAGGGGAAGECEEEEAAHRGGVERDSTRRKTRIFSLLFSPHHSPSCFVPGLWLGWPTRCV